MGDKVKKRAVLSVLFVIAVFLIGGFWFNLWGKVSPVRQLPLIDADSELLKTDTWRKSYADLVREKGDIDVFDCYTCHDKDKKQELKYDKDNQLVVPEEHSDVVMGHGTHGRNNNCYNCHNDENLTQLQPRDGRPLKFDQSTQLCGSCHGPTLRDWESGSHGRTSGHWDHKIEDNKPNFVKKDCVNCHDPHKPKFPKRKPAPPPNHLRENPQPSVQSDTEN